MKNPHIPDAIFEQHIILLGKTRSGKSSTARVLVEYLLDQKKPVCIVDPKGDWWGIKSSADGKHAGYSLVIFGGEHADVPINEYSGASVAELVATGNRSALIDLGGWMPGERTRFWIDFASAYFRTHKGQHHLVIDEVHNFCPKGKIMDPNAGKMLHWSNRLASEGLGKGIAMIAASQRPQKVHNDFLTSCETLMALRVIHKADRDALKDWVDACGDPETGREVLNTVAQNKRGEAWVYSPEAEFGPSKVQFPMFTTYDSFRPRGIIEKKLPGWADVDLDDVKSRLANVVKEAEANDPKLLRAEIQRLRTELGKKTPIVEDHTKELAAADKRLALLDGYISDVERYVVHLKKDIQSVIDREPPSLSFAGRPLPPLIRGEHPYSQSAQERRKVNPMAAPPRPPRIEANGDVSSSQMRILKSLAELDTIGQSPAAKETVAFWSEQRSTSGGYFNNLGKLRSTGLIEYPNPGTVRLTDAGREKIGVVSAPDSDEVIRRVESLLSGSQRRILEVLRETHPEPIGKDELAERSGQKSTSGGYFNNLGAMRTAGLLDYPSPGNVLASSWLFLE